MSKGKATLLKDNLDGFRGHAALYKLDPPLLDRNWDDEVGRHEFVIVSATTLLWSSGCETYIFPATQDGKVSSWGELTGSMDGTLDHADALGAAGYEIVTP
jgi:hypothetical protein